MSWSFGEIEHLVRKATRGAGRPWGVAEEAGWAVRWLCARGVQGAEVFTPCLTASLDECPVFAGMALSDAGTWPPPRTFAAVVSPVMMLPFLARLCPHQVSLALRCGETKVTLGHDDIVIDGPTPRHAEIAVESIGTPVGPREKQIRVRALTPDALALLEEYAARTYAPETEQSRMTGAGAGLSDND